MNKKMLTIVAVLILFAMLFPASVSPALAKNGGESPAYGNVPTPISPIGSISSSRPTFQWSNVSSAVYYQLRVYKGTKVLYTVVYSTASICGSASYCLATPSTVLSTGNYKWQVRAFVTGAYRNFSTSKAFSYNIPATAYSPNGTTADITPTFTWSKVASAARYQIMVLKAGSTVYTKDLPTADCGSDIFCIYTPTVVLIPGNYTWKVQAKVGSVWQAYSSQVAFTVSAAPGEMVTVSAGSFQMGCDPAHNAGYTCAADELPLHSITLSAYQIDKYEVTNAQYAYCVSQGWCTAPADYSSSTRSSYYNNSAYGSYPVIHVTWYDAANYCAFATKRLPTEAEWEKAARGTTLRTFPWGDTAAACTYANYNSSCYGDTGQVGNYPAGASQYGAMDMSGNVWEWVADYYKSDYYSDSDPTNPAGPAETTQKVRRGGAWSHIDNFIRLADRGNPFPDQENDLGGFRCVK